MELKEKRSVVSRELKTLEPGSLYITISVPRSSSYGPDSPVSYPTCLSEDLDLASYEVSCAKGIDREEFDWGVYLHRGYGNGTWYELRRVSCTIDAGIDGTLGSSSSSMSSMGIEGAGIGDGDGASVVACSLPFYTLSRREMRLSPRLQTRVAALIRVLRVPESFADSLTLYLDWLAVQTAPSATRSFIWASSMYIRTRHHLSAYANGSDGDVAAATGFTTTGFLQEALHLAYKEVWYGLGGQLPRPMMASAFGVEMLMGEASTANMQQQQNADQDADDKSTKFLWGYVYHQHAETGLYDTPCWSSITYTGVAVFEDEAISIDSSV
ncbi:hypothetical protein T069G_07502 [Trichoderma breve]|uniref:Uncharacterized protein n=1 Tax=Trichoderma breve TaxID=2034170 RepID=A0A9W9E6G7_9HYPO|nr:hypothetical protein T069G_07502 [Trichoderma breve]KAJ4859235.1 hypothetical protein T069G_07502 [Trichoderma breve]